MSDMHQFITSKYTCILIRFSYAKCQQTFPLYSWNHCEDNYHWVFHSSLKHVQGHSPCILASRINFQELKSLSSCMNAKPQGWVHRQGVVYCWQAIWGFLSNVGLSKLWGYMIGIYLKYSEHWNNLYNLKVLLIGPPEITFRTQVVAKNHKK